jgi:hypothetical protein
VPVGGQTPSLQPESIAAGDPVLCVERQELGQRLLLAAIEHIALVLSDDQGEPRDLSGKVTKLDAPEIRQRDFPGQMLKIIAENLPHRAFVAQRLRETARRHANLAIAASLARDAVNRARPAGPLSASAAWASPRRWP